MNRTRYLISLLGLCTALVVPMHGQVTRAAFNTAADLLLEDDGPAEEITPEAIGTLIKSLAASSHLALTDGTVVVTSGSYADPTWLTGLAWSKIGTTPTTLSGYGITDAQGLDTDLTTWASLTPSANAQSLVTAANYAAMRALLDLEVGTDFYSIAAADAAFDAAGSAATAQSAVQADVDQNETDADAAIAAVQADVDQNETDADAAIAAVQNDVDQNESDADTAIAAVQNDVDQNETDADNAIALKQNADADLDDLADGSLGGAKVGFGIDAANISNGVIDPNRLATGTSLQILRRNAGNTALEYATISAGGGDISAASIDTLAELNAIVGDATLIDGTLSQSQFAARAPRRAIVSAGTVPMATIPNTGAIDPATANFSVFGYKTRGTGSTDYLYAFGSSISGSYLYFDATKLQFHIGTDAVVFDLGSHGLSAGEWALIAVTVDRAGLAKGYINGVLIGSADISAKSAQSATPGASVNLNLGGNTTDGGRSGSYGEFGWTESVLTAAQIAAIHANGTARGSGLTMLAHWVPPVDQDVLFVDVSGNHNHAVLGTTGISLNYEIAAPVNVPTQALVSDGTAGSKLSATLNSQNPSTGDFTLWSDTLMRDNSTDVDVVAALSGSNTDVTSARAFLIYVTSVGVRVQLYGATSSDYRRLSAGNGLLEALKRTRSVVAATRTSAGVKVFTNFGTNQMLEITNLFSESQANSAPEWTDQVDGQYLIGSYRDAGSSYPISYMDGGLELLNFAPSLAELNYRIRNGVWEPKFAEGKTALYTTDFSTSSGWLMSNGTVAIASGVASYDGSADVTMYRNFPSGAEVGMPVRLTFTSSATGKMYLQGNSTTEWLEEFATNYSVNVAVGVNVFEGTLSSVASQRFGIRFRSAGGAWDMDDLTLDILGLTTALNLKAGSGDTIENSRAANGSSHFTKSGGITWENPSVTSFGRTSGGRVANTSPITFSNATSSTNTTTGAAVIGGGLGVAENINAGGTVTSVGFVAGTVQWTAGTGSPEGAVTAAIGSLYSRTNGSTSTTLYVKESGTGNTGWVAK